MLKIKDDGSTELSNLCKLREWRELNNNVCFYGDAVYVFGGNFNATVECVRNISSDIQHYPEAVNLKGEQYKTILQSSGLIGIQIF